MAEKTDIIVIGAGASGIMAAIGAAEVGARVTLLERNSAIGRKINATGNGRCNFTNEDGNNLGHYYAGNKEFVKGVLESFPVERILEFFESIGVVPCLEDEGKYFPLCGQASYVSEALERKLASLGVTVEKGVKVEDVKADNNGVTVRAEGKTYYGKGVVISAGGNAAPDTGSDGNGYGLASALGHRIVEPMPIIVQMKTKGGFYKSLSGLRVKANVTLEADGKAVRTEYGDLMFFDYGISGPPVFHISCEYAYIASRAKQIFCLLDIVPQINEADLERLLTCQSKVMSNSVEEMLAGIINKKLIRLVLESAGVAGNKPAGALLPKEIKQIASALKGIRVVPTGTKGWENAQATAGGVALEQVDPGTLRSRLNGRVAFCGEILDVQGDCGGYNLTWAWASGHLCGVKLAEAVCEGRK